MSRMYATRWRPYGAYCFAAFHPKDFNIRDKIGGRHFCQMISSIKPLNCQNKSYSTEPEEVGESNYQGVQLWTIFLSYNMVIPNYCYKILISSPALIGCAVAM